MPGTVLSPIHVLVLFILTKEHKVGSTIISILQVIVVEAQRG